MNTNEIKQEAVRVDRELAQAVSNLGDRVAFAIRDARRTCLTCSYFHHTSEHCELAAARPPARVIAWGCDKHDYIPF